MARVPEPGRVGFFIREVLCVTSQPFTLLIDIYTHRNGSRDEFSLAPALTREAEIIAIITCLSQVFFKICKKRTLGLSLESSGRRPCDAFISEVVTPPP